MRTGIYETEHFEVTYTMIRLCDNGANSIILFTNQPTYRQLRYLLGNDADRYEWILQEEQESKYRFLLRMYRTVKQRNLDTLYLNTINDNFIVHAGQIRMLKNTRVIVTLHAINTFFRFKPTLSLRRWVRHFGKRALIKVTGEFNVISDTMVNYLKGKLPAHKQVHQVPGAVFEEGQPSYPAMAFNNHLVVVVPGSVDHRRRNYDQVFELLEKSQHLPVSVVLLGGFAPGFSQEIKERCIHYAALHNNLSFYDTAVVDQPAFDRIMKEAHLVFLPSVIDTVLVDDIAETYGKSICSGNIGDVIKHAKPLVAPVGLALPATLASSIRTYHSISDIVELLGTLINEPGAYQALLDNALHNSRQYTIDKVRAANPSLFA